LTLPKVLYLAHRVPYPPDKGDRIRAFHILRFLARHADVDLACLADEPVPDATVDALRSLCRRLTIARLGAGRWVRALISLIRGRTISEGAFGSAPFRAAVRSWSGQTRYQAVLVSASSMVPYLRIPELASVPAVVDLVDVDSQKWFDYAERKWVPKSWIYRTEGRRLRSLERRLPTWARAVTLVSLAEADLYRRFAAPGEIHDVTNGVDLDYFRGDAPEGVGEGDCIFVGALDYYPNVDAACWFCREVWPRIHDRLPETKLRLVGRRPVTAVQRLAQIPGVEVVGTVPDVRPYLRRAAVVLAPLRIARGLQNKVLEALAMGKAVVASPQALAALRTRPGKHLLAAATSQEWVDAVADLLADSRRRHELGVAGRQYVEDQHDWDRCVSPLASLLGLTGLASGSSSVSVYNTPPYRTLC
jgi:sugar transferase (PEP-CTERM/EpsH1 system associated)